MTGELELTQWRREVAEMYAAVRGAATPQAGFAVWRAGRDRLFQEHPQSPLAAGDPLRASAASACAVLYAIAMAWRHAERTRSLLVRK